MNSLEDHLSFEQIKILADKNRLQILKHLMAAPASLTTLGRVMGKHPAWVRHHLVQLEHASLIEHVETRVNAGGVEKYYQARSKGLMIQKLILPKDNHVPNIVFSGSHDLAVEILAKEVTRHIQLIVMPVGSLDGLMHLRQKICHLSGVHLVCENGEYNLPFIQHFFPDRQMQVITLTNREQGLITAPGNPKRIQTLYDLTREDVTFINRNSGSGTRILLDQQLVRSGILPRQIRGYDHYVNTHLESGQTVLKGEADAALGLHAAAVLYHLDFVHLFDERYDLIYQLDQEDNLLPILETLHTRSFRSHVRDITGYDPTHIGEKIPLKESTS